MSLHYGNKNIIEVYYGSKKIKEIYKGSKLVFGGGLGTPTSYMILTNGTRIDFDLDNTPISNLSTTGSEFTYITINGQSVVKKNIKEVYFGDSYNEVTSINTRGFLSHCTNLVSVDLNGLINVTYTNHDFLMDCSALTSVDLSPLNSVEDIGSWFLRECSSLTSVDLSPLSNVTSNIAGILYLCTSLTSIDLSPLINVTSIGNEVLRYCPNLTFADLSGLSNLTSIGANFLGDCSGLTTLKMGAETPPTLSSNALYNTHNLSLISVPYASESSYKSATNWNKYASKISAIPVQDGYWVHKDTGVKTYFGLEEPSIVDGIMSKPSWASDCSEVKIPSGVTGVGEYCFEGCESLITINIPESVVSLGDYCFASCSALTSIDIPVGVTSLSDGCFWLCNSLTSINIPVGVTSIGGGCFDSCSSLTSITIPESVTNIGTFCFYKCTSLILATVLPAIPPTLGGSAFSTVHASLSIKVHSPYVRPAIRR